MAGPNDPAPTWHQVAELPPLAAVSLGTLIHPEGQLSQALRPAHAEALAEVRDADVKNVDETSWKQAGKLCWLWLAATQTAAVFLIHARRGWAALQALLGQAAWGPEAPARGVGGVGGVPGCSVTARSCRAPAGPRDANRGRP